MKNLFLYLSLLFAFPALASDSEIPEIVVTAKAEQSLQDVLPTSYVLTTDDIEAAQVKDIPALLESVSGITITDTGGRGSTTGVFLRGASSAQTIVLIDGVRVGSATLGSASLNAYPIEAIERIEVVKGPRSGIYGADAVGGVIQLFTRKNAEGIGSLSATYGSDSLQEYSLALHGGNDKHSIHFSAQTEDSDGIDRTSITSGGNDDRDGFEQTAYSLGIESQLTPNTQASLSLLYTDSTVEFDNTFGDDSGFFTDSETFSAALSFSTELANGWRWNNTLGFNEDESITPAFFSEFITERDSIGTELAIDLNDNAILTVGIDYYEEDIETLSDFPVNDRDNTGAYAQILADNGYFSVLASLRHDDNSAYGDETNGSISLGYRFTDNLRLVGSYGTAFVAPSFNSLFFPFFGNPDLLPEESRNSELSLIGKNHRFSWRVSAYHNQVRNLFSFDPSTFLAANIGSADLQGIEFEVSTTLADWQLSANLDFLSAENNDTGIELDDRAEQSLYISASRQWQKAGLRFNLRAENDRFDLSGTRLGSYALVDVSGDYEISDALSVQAKIENLFDRDYTVNLINASERFLTEGIQARLTLRYQF